MYTHYSVLLHEAVDNLNIKSDGIYVDATTGGAGHSALILEKLTKGHLYCFDQDDYALKRSDERLKEINNNYTLIKANFKNLKSELAKYNVNRIDGIIYDLGVSSFQLDMTERGFSYNSNAKLDMRMDSTQALSAYNIVNEYSYNDIVRILYNYGEEPFAKQIAKKIVEARTNAPIETTIELVDCIKSALPAKVLHQKGHPAKQSFQALRIAVNDELRVFEYSINDALDMLNIDGRAVVITFHSLEDRICKTVFKQRTTIEDVLGLPTMPTGTLNYKLITKHPIIPSNDELEENNRSHSAKMRVIERIK